MYKNQSRISNGCTTTRTLHLVVGSLLFLVFSMSLLVVSTVCAQEVFLQTGFEKDTVGNPPNDWEVQAEMMEVSTEKAKTDNKSLAILGGANDETIGVLIETDNSIISVEFWVYIMSGGRSFNFKVVSSDNIGINDGGVYINWDNNTVRLFNGAAWVHIDDFETDTWKYVRVVADVKKSEFEMYIGNDRNQALKDRGHDGLAFRNAAVNPTTQWVAFHVYGILSPGYVDDLLIYEGSEPLNLDVDPKGKLATTWGNIKSTSVQQ